MLRILSLILVISPTVYSLHAEETAPPGPMPAIITTPAHAPSTPAPTQVPAVASPAQASSAGDASITAPVNDGKIQADGSFTASMSGNGNVRYGPSRQSKVAITMKAGQTVNVLGPARGAPDWLLIRLPREANVWMHSKVLTPQDGDKKFMVNEDRAKARDDATLGGTIVAEVAKGEIVESKGRRVGDWYAVYVPSATAYVAKTVLAPHPGIAAMPQVTPISRTRIHQVWDAAQKRYAAYLAAKDRDLEIAALLDWDYLAQQLSEVVDHHPDVQAQAAAQRMKDGIAKMVRAVAKVQTEHGIHPQRNVPGQAPIPEPSDTPTEVAVVDSGPARVPTTGTTDIQSAARDIVVVTPPPSSLYPAVGMVMEQAVPGIGINHVIVDENSNIVAFLKPKEGNTIQMNEYFWRYVGVKGEKRSIDPSLHKLGKDIPLIEVEDLILLKQ